MYVLIFLLFFERNSYLPEVKFHPSFACNFLCRAAHSFVRRPDNRSLAVTETKRFSEGLRNIFCEVCEILALHWFDISCSFSLCVATGKSITVTTCSRFIRALVTACPGNNNYLLTESEVFTGKSRTETLPARPWFGIFP